MTTLSSTINLKVPMTTKQTEKRSTGNRPQMGALLPTTSAIDRVCSSQRGRARGGSRVRAPPKLRATTQLQSH